MRTYKIATFFHDFTDCVEVYRSDEPDMPTMLNAFGADAGLWEKGDEPELTDIFHDKAKLADCMKKGTAVLVMDITDCNATGQGLVEGVAVAAYERDDLT